MDLQERRMFKRLAKEKVSRTLSRILRYQLRFYNLVPDEHGFVLLDDLINNTRALHTYDQDFILQAALTSWTYHGEARFELWQYEEGVRIKATESREWGSRSRKRRREEKAEEVKAEVQAEVQSEVKAEVKAEVQSEEVKAEVQSEEVKAEVQSEVKAEVKETVDVIVVDDDDPDEEVTVVESVQTDPYEVEEQKRSRREGREGLV